MDAASIDFRTTHYKPISTNPKWKCSADNWLKATTKKVGLFIQTDRCLCRAKPLLAVGVFDHYQYLGQ